VVPPGAVVVVFVPPAPDVVVVDPPLEGDVVVVVLTVVVDDALAPPVVVVVEAGTDVVVVVVVVAGAGVGEDGTKMSLTVGPVPWSPKMEDSGFPETSSTAVTNKSATRNTTPAVPAIAFQLNCRPMFPIRLPGVTGSNGSVAAFSRSVAGAPAMADTSRRSVSPVAASVDSMAAARSSALPEPDVVGIASVGADSAPTVAFWSPLALVPPSRRSRVESGARTTTCFTASCPRSIDWATSAVPKVAAIDPMATPMIVPLTPKLDAISAASTAPAADARI
jgi:hypothetical protein